MEKGLGKESAKPKQGVLLLLPRLGNLVVEAKAGAAVVAAGARVLLLLLLPPPPPPGKSLVRGRKLKPRLLRKRKVWSKRSRRKTCGEKMLTLIN